MPPERPSVPSSAVRDGDIIAGKYVVERVLGAGAMGIVVAAEHRELRERVALKVLRPELAQRKEVVARFLREARAAVRIRSEHVARILDVGTTSGQLPYIVMEFLDGCDVQEHLLRRGPLPLSEAAEYVAQACAGVATAHAVGIVHRDLKPSNLYLTRRTDGSSLIKVLDFGVSKTTTSPRDPTDLTVSDGILGSPKYMSPEQARSARSVDVRSDVWSLGVILHHLLAGSLPFSGDSITEVLSSILVAPPKPLREARPEVPAELERIVLGCLRKDPNKRTQSVLELAHELAPWIGPDTRALIARMAGSRAYASAPQEIAREPAAALQPNAEVERSASGGTMMGWQAGPWLRPSRSGMYVGAALMVSAVAAVVALHHARSTSEPSSSHAALATPRAIESNSSPVSPLVMASAPTPSPPATPVAAASAAVGSASSPPSVAPPSVPARRGAAEPVPAAPHHPMHQPSPAALASATAAPRVVDFRSLIEERQ